ncbi:hypothetical protein LIER_07934 [Lithospermum erythrorhizon]|uniref:AT-rich interactive domain-containing protein 1-like n=1 Tax=Lithospermum erythrorhizon TaxID=34254 RepID=A0AAV3PBN9_LITER
MRHTRLSSNQINDTPLSSNWLDYIQDDQHRKVVPVSRRFQADVPDPMSDYEEENRKKYESESLKWLGTKVWEPKFSGQREGNGDVGKGRPDMCPCKFSRDVGCIKIHMTMKRIKLQFELGKAFKVWKFNELGEDVSISWTLEEQKKFESIVKMNCIPEGVGFLKPALAAFPVHSSQGIVSYFFNVYLPRRISNQSRTGCATIDTDDEGREEEEPKSTRRRKRRNAGIGTSRGVRIGKAKFLGGKR